MASNYRRKIHISEISWGVAPSGSAAGPGSYLALNEAGRLILTGSLGGGSSSRAITTSTYKANQTFQETPNGSRTTFTVAEAFVDGTQMVFRDGVLMSIGADYDYTVTNTTTIEFDEEDPPRSDENLRITYVQA